MGEATELKSNEKLDSWYEKNVVDDQDAITNIVDMAKKDLLQHFNIELTDAMALVIYNTTFAKIIEKLQEKRSSEDTFIINIANIVKIGYDNLEEEQSDDMEVAGNFNIFIEDVGKTPVYTDDISLYTAERCVQWMSKNVQDQGNVLEKIASAAHKACKDLYDLHVGEPVCVFPIFAVIHMAVRNYIATKQKEEGSSDEMINFIGCFDIHARKVEGGEVAIEYKPSIMCKLSIKSNVLATAPTES